MVLGRRRDGSRQREPCGSWVWGLGGKMSNLEEPALRSLEGRTFTFKSRGGVGCGVGERD